MNYGLYLSASGVLTNMYRQDVFANNLANVHTPGFKPDLPGLRQREPEAVEDDLGFDVSNRLLEKLGGGVLAGPRHINFSAGAIRPTGRGLDVALTEENAFFGVEQVGSDGETSVGLTRTGSFTVNGQGELVTSDGRRVLGATDQPIVLGPGGEASITSEGVVMQDGEEVARLGVFRVTDLDALTKGGGNTFEMPGEDIRETIATPHMTPRSIEASGVDAVMALMDVTNATKAVSANANMMRYFDLTMDRAVNTLGRVEG